MRDYNKAAGAMLRTLRRQRGLTQIEAAHLLNTSSPVLSRKERGQEQIERLDVQLAIVGYQLTEWESQALWHAAGYLPEPLPQEDGENVSCVSRSLLTEIPFPAFLKDPLGQVKAWNQLFAALSTPNAPQPDPTLTDQPDAGAWRFYAEEEHGDAVVAKWPEIQQNRQGLTAQLLHELGEVLVQYASPLGSIDYLVLQAPFSFPQACTLLVYMPFGLENHLRFEQWKAQMELNRLFVGA